MRAAWEAHQRLDALLAMLEDDGAEPPGSVDVAYIAALRSAPAGQSEAVAQAHKDNADPPAFEKGGN